MRRPLSSSEIYLIESLIVNLDNETKNIVTQDACNSDVNLKKTGAGWIYEFNIRGYSRPVYRGQHGYPVEGVMSDVDGAKINVYLYADENNKLLELELIRGEDGRDIISPLFNTLNILY